MFYGTIKGERVAFMLKIILEDPPILVIISVFLMIVIYTLRNYINVKKQIEIIVDTLNKYKKQEISYRFKELDSELLDNPYISSIWSEFKNTLIISDKIALKDKNDTYQIEEIASMDANVYATVDTSYFFNESTLVKSKYNGKFIGVAPTFLTGMGPLFTFLKMAEAFASLDFSTAIAVTNSVASLMHHMQLAAMCSVLAVAGSLVYILVEKLSYSALCEKPLRTLQMNFCKLFDVVASEKFLIDLLKESKVQNHSNSVMLSYIPEGIYKSIDKVMTKTMTPYLEHLVFGINKLTDTLIKAQKKTDSIDNLF